MPEIAAQFEASGHVLTERWWEVEGSADYSNPKHYGMYEDRAVADFMGVVNADAVVVINHEKSEGKAVEMGFAIALFKPIILVGPPSNLFHFMPSVHQVKDVRAAIKSLAVRAAFESQVRNTRCRVDGKRYAVPGSDVCAKHGGQCR